MMMSGSKKPLPSEIARATKAMKSLDLPTIAISRRARNGAAHAKGDTVYNADTLDRVIRSFDEMEGKLTKLPAA